MQIASYVAISLVFLTSAVSIVGLLAQELALICGLKKFWIFEVFKTVHLSPPFSICKYRSLIVGIFAIYITPI